MRDPCMITHSFLVGSLAECVQKQTVKNRKKYSFLITKYTLFKCMDQWKMWLYTFKNDPWLMTWGCVVIHCVCVCIYIACVRIHDKGVSSMVHFLNSRCLQNFRIFCFRLQGNWFFLISGSPFNFILLIKYKKEK